jgi:hypothetical protein
MMHKAMAYQQLESPHDQERVGYQLFRVHYEVCIINLTTHFQLQTSKLRLGPFVPEELYR